MSIKKKLLIVGAFPKNKKKVYGGVLKSCNILKESNEFKQFEIIPFDSSQISHPAPNIIVRLCLALKRLIKFHIILITKKPDGVLIFCSDGGSAIEKGVMVFAAKTFNFNAYIFPRAGNLISQVSKSFIFLILIRFLFKKADLFFCQGEKWLEFANKHLNIELNKIKIISNWSATENLLKIGTRRKINSSKCCLRIIYVGWLEKEKGILELLNSFVELQKKNLNVELILIGDGSLKKNIENFKIETTSDNLKLKGWLNEDEIGEYLALGDIFVLPSWHEGMPNALIEALASGLPAITTSVGVIPDYLVNNSSALLVEPKNSNILRKSIENLINDNNLRKKLSKNGFLVAKKNFSTKKNLQKLSKCILQNLN